MEYNSVVDNFGVILEAFYILIYTSVYKFVGVPFEKETV